MFGVIEILGLLMNMLMPFKILGLDNRLCVLVRNECLNSWSLGSKMKIVVSINIPKTK